MVFCRDGSWDIFGVECGWEWKALEVVLLEVTKQGSGGGMVLGIGLQTIEVHRGLFEWREEAVRMQLKFKIGGYV